MLGRQKKEEEEEGEREREMQYLHSKVKLVRPVSELFRFLKPLFLMHVNVL